MDQVNCYADLSLYARFGTCWGDIGDYYWKTAQMGVVALGMYCIKEGGKEGVLVT